MSTAVPTAVLNLSLGRSYHAVPYVNYTHAILPSLINFYSFVQTTMIIDYIRRQFMISSEQNFNIISVADPVNFSRGPDPESGFPKSSS